MTASNVTRTFPFDNYIISANSVTTQYWMTGQMIWLCFITQIFIIRGLIRTQISFCNTIDCISNRHVRCGIRKEKSLYQKTFHIEEAYWHLWNTLKTAIHLSNWYKFVAHLTENTVCINCKDQSVNEDQQNNRYLLWESYGSPCGKMQDFLMLWQLASMVGTKGVVGDYSVKKHRTLCT